MNCHRLVVLLNGPLRFAVNSSFVQDLHVACVNRKHKGDSLGIHVRSVCVCVRACQCSEDTHHLCNSHKNGQKPAESHFKCMKHLSWDIAKYVLMQPRGTLAYE